MTNKSRSEKASKNLQEYLEKVIADLDFPPPLQEETEPQYTARVVMPLVREAIACKVSNTAVWVKGDGAALQAFSRTFFGFRFHPDIAVGQDLVNYWCAEVKLSRSGFNGDILAKAVGQAYIYRQAFPAVTILLINAEPTMATKPSRAENLDFGVNVIEVRTTRSG
jgi:hypothetical protein